MTEFRTSPARMFLRIALVLVPLIVLIRGLFMVAVVAADVALDFGDFAGTGLFILVLTGAVGAGTMAGARRHPGWARVSAAGLEFAAPQHRATFLPWEAVASVRMRFAGPYAQLVVTPTGPEAASFFPGPGQTARLRRGAFVIEAGTMTPGPAALLAAIDQAAWPSSTSAVSP